ncbi:pre-mRNA-splicing factor CWC25 homolog isoform X2 [Pelmatolapia mariae]|uniref:pre-mRNA-splicing factor CWC25 homolog isoform X2 n=1 Tax=Pelmatolapia mariae TaxID=158779 RepID=UPI002FE549DE
MGGGDLNLKKSWHPQTMKNIERVWKAEQKHEAERKKIEELQKQLKEERAREEMTKYAEETGVLKRKDDRLDWMYQGPAGQVSRDEYLLGRPIDKQITDQYEEPESGPSAETGLLPGSIFNPTTPASSLDLAAKIREDPLFEIRKREEAKKREVLTNPVKMKKIKEMVTLRSKKLVSVFAKTLTRKTRKRRGRRRRRRRKETKTEGRKRSIRGVQVRAQRKTMRRNTGQTHETTPQTPNLILIIIIQAMVYSSQQVDINRPQPPPVTQGDVRGADPDHLTGITRTAAPTLHPPHIGVKRSKNPKVPAHRRTDTRDRGTTCLRSSLQRRWSERGVR